MSHTQGARQARRDMPDAAAGGRVLFICQHGALRSRIAAAYFNAWAPAGWSATSAGVDPQSEPSARLAPAMAGTVAEDFVDGARPRSIADVETTHGRLIAIDTELPDAEKWSTGSASDEGDAALRDEISRRVRALVDEIAPTEGGRPE